MAFFDDSQASRTEQPTARHRRQARDRGLVARSAELLLAARLLAIWVVLALWTAGFVRFSTNLIRDSFEHAQSGQSAEVALTRMQSASWAAAHQTGLPLMIVTAALIVAHFSQVGWHWHPEHAAPKFSRLSPSAGLAKLMPTAVLARGAGLLAKLLLITTLAWFALFDHWSQSVSTERPELSGIVTTFGTTATRMISQVTLGLLVWGIADYFLQRWRFNRSLRMTREEVRKELSDMEGDIHIKSQRQALARNLVSPHGNVPQSAELDV